MSAGGRYSDPYVDRTRGCTECGSLVFDTYAHDHWHDAIKAVEGRDA